MKLMRSVLVILALVGTFPASAQNVVTLKPGADAVSGSLVGLNDTVTLAISGAQFATARLTMLNSGNATHTVEISIDGGVNWLPAPYARLISSVSANPSVSALVNSTLTPSTFDIPLPGNTTHIRDRCAAGGSAAQVTLSGGALYVPGTPVYALLYDVTSATGSGLDTGIMDVSGYSGLTIFYSGVGGTAGMNVWEVDDSGSNMPNILFGEATASPQKYYGLGVGTTFEAASAAGTSSKSLPLPRRIRFIANSVAGVTNRLRIQARR